MAKGIPYNHLTKEILYSFMNIKVNFKPKKKKEHYSGSKITIYGLFIMIIHQKGIAILYFYIPKFNFKIYKVKSERNTMRR